MSDKKYQIFVSSTYTDLKNTRSKVIDTILNIYHFPVGMEFFSAGDAEQWEIIKELIDDSDYYLVIIGHRYGSSAGNGISYTEKEYDYAVEKGVPVMSFIRDRDVPTLSAEREKSVANNKKLDSFISKASASKMCDFWQTDDELATKVAVALPKLFHRTPRTGWVRGNTAMTPEVANEIAASSRENRALREELDLLRSNIVVKEPQLDLSVDGDWTFLLENYEPILKPALLSISDIPHALVDYISDNDINEYNENIPDDESLENYNLARRLYQEVKNNAYVPVFKISNTGSAKANDIIVTIKLPPILGVLSKYDYDTLDEITEILLPNPIDVAKKKHLAQINKNKRSSIFNIDTGFTSLGASLSPITMPSLHDFEINDSRVNENTIIIRLNSLIHTQNRIVDEGIRVFPKTAGQEDILVTIIYEELATPLTFHIPVQIR